MELRQIRYFLSVAETEHLTQSAQALFITQSTLSHGLRQLESELGMPLFDRIGRGLKLSQAGIAFRSYAQRALQELDAGRMALADMAGLQSGTLTVGVIPTFLTHFIPDVVAAFSAQYPGVQVMVRDLRSGQIEEQLIAGQLDLGIAFHPAGREEIEAEPLFDERMHLVVHESHPLAKRRTLRMRDLADVPLALLPVSFATRRLMDAAFAEANTKPQVRVEMESVDALLLACRRAPQLATIAAEHAATHAGADMRAILLTEPRTVRRAGVLWRRDASRSAAAREFAGLLKPAVKQVQKAAA
ncbi:transcriptional regulator CynR [Diaphorobacter sp. HDW4A]|uniref:transcriptional regulator CynR n=1 Tax=Diaphorobacter sp. HDW4A TaxID=2714924 RepID=UPI0014088C33|nr:transcriptional regulator CynR [Diaphorobacter sp. HDW4A]QIL82721.1 transcriptional regulator CynR [Diaphorobacter sp. HDW4A]